MVVSPAPSPLESYKNVLGEPSVIEKLFVVATANTSFAVAFSKPILTDPPSKSLESISATTTAEDAPLVTDVAESPSL